MRKANTLIMSAAILIASATAQGTPPLPPAGKGGIAQREAGISPAAASAGEQKITFDIEATQLARALIQLTEQSGLQLIYPAGDRVTDLPAKPLKGEYTPESALKQLLKGTGLSYEFIDAKTISIVDPGAKSAIKTSRRGTDGALSTAPLRLAQNTGTSAATDASEARTPEASASESPNKGESRNSDSSGNPEALQEVVVTAEKRQENLQDVPATITAFGADAIVSNKVDSLRAVESLLPSIALPASTGSVAMVFIRGVGQAQNAGGNTPAAGFYFDGMYVDRSFGATAFADVERVEVLAGPQGTLYGQGSAAGAINVLSRSPGRERDGYAIVDVGNYSSYNAAAAINLPVTEAFRTRMALDVRNRDGYLTNDLNDQDVISGRISALYEPNERFSALLKAYYSRDNSDGSTFVMYNGITRSYVPGANGDPWWGPYDRDTLGADGDSSLALYTGDIRYSFDHGLAVTYVPGYLRSTARRSIYIPYDADLPNPTRSVANFGVNSPVTPTDAWQHEVRLSQDIDRLHWVLGLYRFHQDNDRPVSQGDAFNITPGIATLPTIRYSIPGQQGDFRSDSKAVFGQATYSLTDKLRLTAGARYNEAGKHQISHPLFIRTVATGATARSGSEIDLQGTYSDFSYKLGLDVDVAPDVMAYASIATGFEPGGFNVIPPTTAGGAFTASDFKSETITAYTVGVKSRFLQNRLQVNNEWFYYDFADYQLQSFIVTPNGGQTITIFNTDVKIWGADLDMSYLLADHTNLDVRASWLPESEIVDFVSATGQSFAGNRLPRAPKFGLAAGLRHAFMLATGAEVEAAVQFKYGGSYWLNYQHPIGAYQSSYTTTDASLTYNSPGKKWYATLWGKNLENENVFGSWASIEALRGPGWYAVAVSPPRTYGVRVGFYF